MTTYQMTTINNGTRIRTDHTTFAPQITTVGANVIVKGDEKWTATADGNEVKAGDVWIRVTYGTFTGWMAYIHKGVPICKDLKEIAVIPPIPSETFPEYFILESPDGKRVKYVIASTL